MLMNAISPCLIIDQYAMNYVREPIKSSSHAFTQLIILLMMHSDLIFKVFYTPIMQLVIH